MKKIVKKLGILVLTAAWMLLVPAIVSYAADGTLQFSDPKGKVGEEITVKVKMEAGGMPIGDGDAVISYDKAKLEFVSGTNATGGDGTVTLSAAGTGSETELNFELVFKALEEGNTTLEVSSSTAYLYSDETLNLQPGTGTVTIEAGDGTSDSVEQIPQGEANIEINGTMYAIYENFTDALLPDGFSRTKMQYNGSEHNALTQDVSGKTFVFLITGSNDPIMALYEENSNDFIVAELVDVTEDFYILILGEGEGNSLPDTFVETTLELNGTIFPAWQNMDSKEYYLMYALSSTGEEGFYQYDTKEGTYQRYIVPEIVEEEPDTSMLGKAKGLLDQYFLIVVAAIGVVLLLLLIVIIVQSIKLGRRNAELDELYNEYDEEDDRPAVAKKSRSQFVGYDDEDDDDDIDNEYIEDDFSDDDYDDGGDEEEYYDDDYDGGDEEEYYDDDEYYDEDDDYDEDEDDIEFIDL